MSATLRVGAWCPDHPRLPRPARLRAVLPGLRLALPLLPQPGTDRRAARRKSPGHACSTSSADARACCRRWSSAAARRPPGGPRRRHAHGPRTGLPRRPAQRRHQPRAFARVLAQSDWVGFDVKAPAEDVAAITGVDGSGAANWRSLECLLDSGVAYECRTTVHWRLFDSERLWRLATRLREMGVERFAVQLRAPGPPARSAAREARAAGRCAAMARTGRAVSRLRTARRLSLRFSGAARACQLARTGRAVPTRPVLHKTHTIVREHLLDS